MNNLFYFQCQTIVTSFDAGIGAGIDGNCRNHRRLSLGSSCRGYAWVNNQCRCYTMDLNIRMFRHWKAEMEEPALFSRSLWLYLLLLSHHAGYIHLLLNMKDVGIWSEEVHLAVTLIVWTAVETITLIIVPWMPRLWGGWGCVGIVSLKFASSGCASHQKIRISSFYRRSSCSCSLV